MIWPHAAIKVAATSMEQTMLSVSNFISFLRDEDGAVSVDWVVLTAGAMGLAIAVAISLGNSTSDQAKLISSTMSARGVPTF
jgi:Flp pilus assembly pilin Flp